MTPQNILSLTFVVARLVRLATMLISMALLRSLLIQLAAFFECK